MGRRRFLARSGLVFAAGALGSPSGREPRREPERTETPPFPAERAGDWSAVKQAFSLSPDRVHLGALFIATHPRPVREAIERYRDELNRDPVTHLERENAPRQQAVREAAARYLGTHPAEIALTDSTTLEREPKGPTSALRMSPGGFKPFEHQWAVAEAFRFHEDIGKAGSRNALTS
jgi:hypothetical protein